MKIINRSKWPDWALKVLCRWVANRFDLPKDYRFIFSHTVRNTWRGRGWRLKQKNTIRRRFKPDGGWPYANRYHTVTTNTRGHFPLVEHRTRLELLVGLMCHEAKHSVTMDEWTCEQAEVLGIEAFRRDWPNIRASLAKACREVRDRKMKLSESRADSGPKLANAQAMLAKWQAKAKLARTKIKKYERRIRYYEGKSNKSAAKNAF